MKSVRVGLLLALFLTGCAKVHLTTWRGPVLSSQPYRKILVCVSPKDADQARTIERSIVKAFAPYPVAATHCMDVFPALDQLTAEAMMKTVQDQSFDAVLVLERESIIHWSKPSGKASESEEETLPEFFATYASGSRPDAAALAGPPHNLAFTIS